MNFFYKTVIDRVHANYISGWCFHRFAKSKKVKLLLWQGDSLIGETCAELFREDIAELGLHPTGKCGFELLIDQTLDTKKPISLKVEGGSIPLAEILIDGTIKKNLFRVVQKIRKLFVQKRISGPTIIFLHVPKTAGTTFNTVVRALVPADESATHIELLDRDSYHQLPGQYRFISGHLRVGVLKEFFPLDNISLYTILREPYSHLHSHLKWLIQTSANSEDNFFKYSNPEIYDLGLRLRDRDFSDTDVLRRFAAGISGVEAAFIDNMQTRYFLDHQPARVTQNDYEQAVNNTKLFKEIGLTENFDLFLSRFVHQNSLQKPQLTKKLNRSHSSPLFDVTDNSVREALSPLVYFDLQLYNHVNNGMKYDQKEQL